MKRDCNHRWVAHIANHDSFGDYEFDACSICGAMKDVEADDA